MNRSGIHLNKWWPVAICAGLTLLAVLHLGQDRNWDLANYHLYNPHALLGGRYGFDIAPAQLQTWHNPMLDVPLYLLVKADMPGLLISLWLALPSMLALIAGNKVLGNLLDRPHAPWETAAFALVATTAPAMYSTLGSSMNDGFVAAAMLVALAIACRKGSGWRDWALAGLIAGGIAGLKLTALVYCIGLAASACARGPLKGLPVRLVALAIGGLAGFLVSYGFWGFYLWETHGNPLFPYLNQVFESPDVAPIAWTDVRFRPDGLGEALLVPFRLLVTSNQFSELPARSALLLAGLASAIALPWVARNASAEARSNLRAILAFLLVSFSLWALQYGILRYTTPLEVLSAAALMALVAQLPRMIHWPMALAASLFMVFFSVQPDWGRNPFSRHLLTADWPNLPRESMVVTSSNAPLGYFALGLPGDVPIVALYNNVMNPGRCAGLQATAEMRVREFGGSLWLLEEQREDADIEQGRRLAREAYGLHVAEPCTTMRSSFGPLRLCPLQRTPSERRCLASP